MRMKVFVEISNLLGKEGAGEWKKNKLELRKFSFLFPITLANVSELEIKIICGCSDISQHSMTSSHSWKEWQTLVSKEVVPRKSFI